LFKPRQTALDRYKIRRGGSASPGRKKKLVYLKPGQNSAAGPSGPIPWRYLRLAILLLLLICAAYPLLPGPSYQAALTYELDLERAPEGSLTITLIAQGQLPPELDLEFPPGIFGDDDNGVTINAPVAHTLQADGSQGTALVTERNTDGWRVHTEKAPRIGFIYQVDLARTRGLETDIRRFISTPITGGVRAAGFEIFLEPVNVELEDLTVTLHNPGQLPLLVPWPALVRGGQAAAAQKALPTGQAHLGFGEGFQPVAGELGTPGSKPAGRPATTPLPVNLFYHPRDLADLNNSLLICGDIRTLDTQARDTVIRFATDRNWHFEDHRVLNLLRTIARAEIGFFGSAPTDQITVLLAANEVRAAEGFDIYGVHTGSSVLVLLDPGTNWDTLRDQAASVIAHEMFHGWLGEAIRQNDPTMLWFTEGATTWYAARLLASSGVWDPDHTRMILRTRLERDYAGSDLLGKVSVAEAAAQVMASRDVVAFAYAGGTAACMGLDSHLARRTGQDAPLDEVLRHLYRHRDNQGLTREKLEEAVLAVTGVRCSQWLDHFVYGRESLDPAEQLIPEGEEVLASH
jgi:hypothetical protein